MRPPFLDKLSGVDMHAHALLSWRATALHAVMLAAIAGLGCRLVTIHLCQHHLCDMEARTTNISCVYWKGPFAE